MIPLGEKLRRIIRAEEDRKRAIEEERKRALAAAEEAKIAKMLSAMADIRTTFTGHINAGGIPPKYKMPEALLERLDPICLSSSPYRHLWLTHMEEWARSEGLTLKVTHEHDGVGMESWYMIHVGPDFEGR